jgi:hypothetical protein
VSPLLRKTLIAVAIGVALYVIALLVFGVQEVSEELARFSLSALFIALGASSLNYLLRFWKWELCLRWLQVREREAPDLTLTRSLIIYLAGLSMSVTPGKVGEVLRSSLLRASDGVPFARTAPVVVADRLTDLIALVLLTLVGVAEHDQVLPYVLATVVLVVAGVVILGSPRLLTPIVRASERLPVIGPAFSRAGALVDSSATLMRLRHLLPLTVISTVGWALECAGYWFILRGFVGVEASLSACIFAWAATTIIGALRFLPGGLGATEISLGALIPRIAVGVTQPIAVASTLLIRGATLWYGELVGAVCLLLTLRWPDRGRSLDRVGEETVDLPSPSPRE